MLNPDASTILSNLSFLSPDSVCYSFDERANGYARGEGILAMVVKPFENAIRDGDVIRAVIRATGANQDGRTPSLTQPNADAQESLIRHVYQKAGLGFSQTGYVEAHGTGTPTGDPIEATAIGRVFGEHGSAQDPILIGSIKGNIGHVEAGSGLAGTLRAVLAVEKGLIPPQALFKTMNPAINSDLYNLDVPISCMPWPKRFDVRRASVNSFSLGGSNAHIVLDDALSYLRNRGLHGYHNCTMYADGLGEDTFINGTTYSSSESITNISTTLHTKEINKKEARLLVWSGADPGAIDRFAHVYKSYLKRKVGRSHRKLNQLAYTLSSRRSQLQWRSFAIASADNIISDDGTVCLAMTKPTRLPTEKSVAAFVFTGQGAQYASMSIGLLSYKVFADTLQRIDSIFSSFGSTWKLVDVLQDDQLLHSPQFSQPLCTALQIAIVELLRSVHVTPCVVMGHSSGEIAAAYTAGALSLESACKVAYYRGVVSEKLKSETVATPGSMISVNLERARVYEYLESMGIDNIALAVHVACVNSPTNCTLSGDEHLIDLIKDKMDEDQIFARKLNTGVAYHSPAMKMVAAEYAELLGHLDPGTGAGRGQTTIASSVTGRLMADPSCFSSAQYWVDNLISPVLFADALQSIAVKGGSDLGLQNNQSITDFIEVGPDAVLRRPIKDTLEAIGTSGSSYKGSAEATELKSITSARYHSVLHRSKQPLDSLLSLLGNLFCIGYPVSIELANHHDANAFPPPLVDCPRYPFDLTKKYWYEGRISKDTRLRPHAKGVMIGKRSPNWNQLRPSFHNWLGMDAMPWLEEHCISGKVVCPGMGMIVMTLEGLKHLVEMNAKTTSASISGFQFQEAHFLKPIPVPEDSRQNTEVSLCLRPKQEVHEKDISWWEAALFAHNGSNWTECFHAVVQVHREQSSTEVDGGRERREETAKYRKFQDEATDSCDKAVNSEAFYQYLRHYGMAYGPSFSVLRGISWDGIATSQATIPHDLMLDSGEASPMHPAVLDAAIHFPLVQISKGLSIPLDTYVPQEVYGLWISAKNWKVPDSSVVITTAVDFSRPSALKASISVFNEEGTMLLSLERGLLASVSSNDESKLGEEQPRLIYKMERLPLLSQLTSADLQVACEPEPYQQSEMEKSWSDRLEAALIYSAQDALYRLYSSGFDITSAPAHLQTFINVLQRNYGPNSNHRKEFIDQELAKCLEYSPSWGLYTQAGRFLEPLLRSEADPLDLLVSSEVADRSYALLFDNAADDRLFRFLELASHENPGLRILEIGSGTGGLTAHALSHLEQLEKRVGSMRFSRYVFTDISPAFFEAGRAKFARFGDRLDFQKLNIEKAIDTQGFALESFDLVLAGCVLHATSHIAESMGNVRTLLRQGGHFVALEITQTNLARSLVAFGSLPGWWLSTEDWRHNGPLMSKETWDRVMKQTGFFGIEATWDDGEGGCIMITHAMEATAVSISEPLEQLGFSNKRTLTIVVLDNISELQQIVADRIHQWSGLGSRIITLGDVGAVEWKEDDVVLSLIELGEPLLAAPTREVFENIRTMLTNTQNLLWVALPNLSSPPSSTGAVDPRFEVALGFLRTIRYEEPSKDIVTLSCCNRATLSEANVVRFIKDILCQCFRPQNPLRENEFVIEKNTLCADRLIYDTDQEEDRLARIFPSLQPGQTLGNAPPTILSPGSPGMLNTLRLVETETPVQMARQTVEIECRAWPVSFRDVLIALDRYGDQSDTSGMGWELAGVVSRVGPGVSEFKPGDRVCTGEVAGMRSHVQAKEDMVFKIPDGMSFARSVAALNPLMTAHHGLVNVARLKRGETILIHAAAGSTGQMAVCIAQRIGAQVYATVGFDDKKKLLMEEFGIPESNIFYSRDTSFKLGILRETAGRGVDVVLNSLSGDKLKASWSCIAPFGRFIEIGKADISAGSSLPMSHFAKNATFSAVDLAHLGAEDPDALRDLTRTAVDMLFHTNVGRYPKPVHLFPVAESEKAFRFIQSGKNTGRTIITLDPEDTVSVSGAKAVQMLVYGLLLT
jgi:acyl transferase domain-containing protein/NADPH:quinone reductase-like Zn-dependent oxidoreductase/ubiquinone/menaquinone biosynthesis C-methylase UbiE